MWNSSEQMCFNRAFELRVAQAHREGLIKVPIYLSLGTEHIPPVLRDLYADWVVFPQHRCHSWYLTFGGDPCGLFRELLGRQDGCGAGMHGSPSLSVPNRVYGHSGMLGDNAAIACGYAHATGSKTLCVLGDAACEEDYVLASFGYAATHKLPVLFLVEDNDKSILTPKSTRRSWHVVNVARGFGLHAVATDDRIPNLQRVLGDILATEGLPALVNVQCERHLWHCGSGQDSVPETDRLSELRHLMPEAIADVDLLWRNSLKPSESGRETTCCVAVHCTRRTSRLPDGSPGPCQTAPAFSSCRRAT